MIIWCGHLVSRLLIQPPTQNIYGNNVPSVQFDRREISPIYEIIGFVFPDSQNRCHLLCHLLYAVAHLVFCFYVKE